MSLDGGWGMRGLVGGEDWDLKSLVRNPSVSKVHRRPQHADVSRNHEGSYYL